MADFVGAWNNFVLRSEPSHYEMGDSKRSAAIASLYMSLANNGGIYAFLEGTHELDASEVLTALDSIGAPTAAAQFGLVLRQLGAVPASSQSARSRLLEERWTEAMNATMSIRPRRTQNCFGRYRGMSTITKASI